MGSNNNYLFVILAVITGALIPVQAATNTTFSRSIGNPYITGLMVFIVGLIAMMLFIFISKTHVPALIQISNAPVYSYSGGIVVAIYVVMITVITPKIGVGNAIGLIVTGQIIAAIIIDQFGLFNMPIRTIGISRLVGVVLMIMGIFLVMKRSEIK